MPPGRPALLRASCNSRIIVELVVPYHVVEGPVIYVLERSAQRVFGGFAYAATSFLKVPSFTARIYELLAECVLLHISAERARSFLVISTPAAREGLGVELEDKPPIDWVPFFQ